MSTTKTKTITVANYRSWNGQDMYYNHEYGRWDLSDDADMSDPTRYETNDLSAAKELAEDGMDPDHITLEEIDLLAD
jgi:hypothetical protein